MYIRTHIYIYICMKASWFPAPAAVGASPYGAPASYNKIMIMIIIMMIIMMLIIVIMIICACVYIYIYIYTHIHIHT